MKHGPGATPCFATARPRGRLNLAAVCGACRHSTPIWLWQLIKGRSEYQRLIEVEAKLRGQRCGNRTGNMVQASAADRD
jgi:hypothetical protein